MDLDNLLDIYRSYRIPGLVLLLTAVAIAWRAKNSKSLPQVKGAEPDSNDEALDSRDEQVFGAPLTADRQQEVLALEETRVANGYKPGWLYHRCEELGLLRELRELRRNGTLESPFGERKVSTELIKPKLLIELVPSTCWFSNLRSVLPQMQWDFIRREVYHRAGNRCEICGEQGPKWPVEAHEAWSYDQITGIQKLERIVALCPDCHSVKHIGLAQIEGRGEAALAHLMKVNRWSRELAEQYIEDEFSKWSYLSAIDWETDLSCLTHYGVPMSQISALQELARDEREDEFEMNGGISIRPIGPFSSGIPD